MEAPVKHLAIIMDGNRRWARMHGLPSLEGHRRGYEKVKQVGDWTFDRGIPYLTLFAFSTENWNRSKDEVVYLMALLHRALKEEINEFQRRNIRLKVVGRREGLPKNICTAADEAEEVTKNNTRGTMQLAINYGGHAEIVDAVKDIVGHGVSADQIGEEMIRSHLWTASSPPPDLIIRTSGEQRLSGFLLWGSAYSELYFLEKHWPEFGEEDLERALAEYARRERRYGV